MEKIKLWALSSFLNDAFYRKFAERGNEDTIEALRILSEK